MRKMQVKTMCLMRGDWCDELEIAQKIEKIRAVAILKVAQTTKGVK